MVASIHVPGIRLLGFSGVQVAHTGTTDETILATVVIPAGAMGANGHLIVESTWSNNNDASVKRLRCRLGGISGTEFLNNGSTTTISWRDYRIISNRNNAALQISGVLSTPMGASGGAIVTGTVNTAIAQDLVFTAQLADGTDNLNLEFYKVSLVYKA